MSSRRSPCRSVRGPAASSAPASAETSPIALRTCVADVVRHGIGERVPGRLQLLRQQVGPGALGLGDPRSGHPEAIAEGGGSIGNPAGELGVKRRRRIEHLPALGAGEPALLAQKGGREVAHQHPPPVAVVDHRSIPWSISRHAAEGARPPQQRGRPAVPRHPTEPIGGRTDPLRDQLGPVGEDHPFERCPGVAGMLESGAARAGADALQDRLRELVARLRAGAGGVAPQALDPSAVRPQVPAAAIDAPGPAPLEGRGDARRPLVRIPEQDIAGPRPLQVGDDRLAPSDRAPAGIAAGVEHGVGCDQLAERLKAATGDGLPQNRAQRSLGPGRHAARACNGRSRRRSGPGRRERR